MKTDERLPNEKVRDWNLTLHSILKNFAPFLALVITKDFHIAFCFKIILSNISLKDLIKEIKDKGSK
jgi:hypothetical protein